MREGWTQQQAEEVWRWFEDPAFTQLVAPRMRQREEWLKEQLLRTSDEREADQLRGRVKEMRGFMEMRREADQLSHPVLDPDAGLDPGIGMSTR